MEINNNSSIIKEVLSLRYCPSLDSSKNKIVAENFLPEEKLNYLEHIENSISSEIKNEVMENQVSVALSGGVDSTLVMALLRKTKPDIKIDAISLKLLEILQISLMLIITLFQLKIFWNTFQKQLV